MLNSSPVSVHYFSNRSQHQAMQTHIYALIYTFSTAIHTTRKRIKLLHPALPKTVMICEVDAFKSIVPAGFAFLFISAPKVHMQLVYVYERMHAFSSDGQCLGNS